MPQRSHILQQNTGGRCPEDFLCRRDLTTAVQAQLPADHRRYSVLTTAQLMNPSHHLQQECTMDVWVPLHRPGDPHVSAAVFLKYRSILTLTNKGMSLSKYVPVLLRRTLSSFAHC